MANIIVVRQKEALGLGHAVLRAKKVVQDEPFAVMVGDDLMFNRDPGMNQVLDVWKNERMPVVGVMEVPRDKVSRYGIIDAEEYAPGLYRIRGVKEKPSMENAPSRLAVVGRYVLTPEVFNHLEALTPDQTGEIQLTDALDALARQNRLLAVKLRGQRFDVGDWVDYLTANIYFALQDEDLRYDLIDRLRELIPAAR